MLQTTRHAVGAFATFSLFIALALSGCSSSSSPGVASIDDGNNPPRTTKPESASPEGDGVKFAECMREHGIDVPDPEQGESDGAIQFALPRDTDSKIMGEAMQACRKFLPNGGEPTKVYPEQLAEARKFSECMRENGIEDFPDPNPDGGIMIEGEAIDLNDEFKTAQEACSEYLPASGEAPGQAAEDETP